MATIMAEFNYSLVGKGRHKGKIEVDIHQPESGLIESKKSELIRKKAAKTLASLLYDLGAAKVEIRNTKYKGI